MTKTLVRSTRPSRNAAKPDRAAFRAWSKSQARIGRRLAMPSILIGLVVTGLAIGQAWCIAVVLAHALASVRPPVVLSSPSTGISPPGAELNPSWGPLLGFTVLALVRVALQVVQETRAAGAASVSRRRLRSQALVAILAHGPALLRSESAGALTSLVMDRIEALDGFFGRWIPAAALALLSPAAVLVAVAFVQPPAALVLLACGIAVPFAQAAFGIGAAVASRQQFTALARLQARFLDRMRGISTIVLAGRADDEAQRLGLAAAELRRRTMRVLRVAFLSSAALDCAFAVALVGIALLDKRALLHGGATQSWLGALLLPRSLFALILVPEFFAPLRTFALAYQDRMQAVGASEALGALPPLPAASPSAGGSNQPASDRIAPQIRTVAALGVTVAFDSVGFSWDPTRGRAIDDLSFRIPAQETVILVGPSGSGKSTLIEMLLGFIHPDSGRITLNGADIATIVPAALSQMTAWIGQRPLLFSGSIRDNVLFARPDATAEQLADALRNASLESFVSTLPDGIDTRIGEGGYGLSGGQAQRVAIARAFLRNAPLLLLDEPTAHLDPVTEREILDSLRRLAVGRTVLLASHSSAAHAFSGRRIDLLDGRLLQRTVTGGPA